MDESPMLLAENVHAAYPDGTVALRGLSLSVASGCRLALLGPNGAGKTSLMLAIMGALPAGTGRLTVAGVEVKRKTLHEVRRRCGMVFQQADDQLFMPTLLEDVAFGPLNQLVPPPRAAELAERTLDEVGLPGMGGKSGHHLSEGQKRAAAIATVLAMQVQVLLLDEPAANLDARHRAALIRLLRSRRETLILSTHDLPLAQSLCDTAVILRDGQVAAHGPCAEILANQTLLREHGLVCEE